ncbi:DUF3168 domain-containing protein [Brevundimonas sp. 2R-24]|uniref:DUF3168 domain-containing protein n=1 Tax=Peiella sedimenti TaxID=3061083 RepID=A0ABT8SQ81_9CAUL|nr:DUF3168 domain-containing protein [Caulobacteraceae bacterium XZ-24]
MIDAQAALQKAIIATTRASTPVKAVLGDPPRVYDRSPQEPTAPYATFGPMQSIDAGDQCHEGVEVYVELNVWSEAVGMQEAQAGAAALMAELDAALTVEGFEIIIHACEGAVTNRDPDGLTIRSRLTFRYVLAPTA